MRLHILAAASLSMAAAVVLYIAVLFACQCTVAFNGATDLLAVAAILAKCLLACMQQMSLQTLQEDKDFAARVIAKLEENEVNEDELIEQRRRKRQELLMKLQQEQQASSELPDQIWHVCWVSEA